jgi:hypothetical protein
MSRALAKRFYRLRRLKRRLISPLTRRWKIFSALLRAHAPVRLKHYRSDDSARELLIFLPGIGDVLEDYESRGFIDAAHKSGVALDITVADMHFGYYVTRTAVERLRDDIILPAQADGYSRISLAGISLGGFGALYYAINHPDDEPRQLWCWLKRRADNGGGLKLPDFYLAYGLQDAFAAGNKLLGDLLPAGHVYTIHGKHNWTTWISL